MNVTDVHELDRSSAALQRRRRVGWLGFWECDSLESDGWIATESKDSSAEELGGVR